ncbi:hypothetical protein ADK66_04625 [Micromonospora sp. NRRL B-16802]|nr:hypothetical protein ADK66_04625 [Micromonospora sp. NRRL B-16802]
MGEWLRGWASAIAVIVCAMWSGAKAEASQVSSGSVSASSRRYTLRGWGTWLARAYSCGKRQR